ncbi:hypothetical protein K435DRAFT_128161 [Dendrothele bispora CBS 962.96]|uniref:Uncharacterized protein n=1 Tax=Dendrothele bispora (strain CBS 962.96) TaxID=1314807 RepID=A0A4S8M0A8_DENBC|nr:hypothetical protein K435DRAFT_128161 [Dendrothele bispora CBS 962.96]
MQCVFSCLISLFKLYRPTQNLPAIQELQHRTCVLPSSIGNLSHRLLLLSLSLLTTSVFVCLHRLYATTLLNFLALPLHPPRHPNSSLFLVSTAVSFSPGPPLFYFSFCFTLVVTSRLGSPLFLSLCFYLASSNTSVTPPHSALLALTILKPHRNTED